MLTDILQKVKVYSIAHRRDLVVAASVLLIGITSFGLGRLSALWPAEEPIAVENLEAGNQNLETTQANTSQTSGLPDSKSQILNSAQGAFVASRKGTAYHLPFCPGAQKISEANKIWFQTRQEAEAAGYKPAANCPGL